MKRPVMRETGMLSAAVMQAYLVCMLKIYPSDSG